MCQKTSRSNGARYYCIVKFWKQKWILILLLIIAPLFAPLLQACTRIFFCFLLEHIWNVGGDQLFAFWFISSASSRASRMSTKKIHFRCYEISPNVSCRAWSLMSFCHQTLILERPCVGVLFARLGKALSFKCHWDWCFVHPRPQPSITACFIVVSEIWFLAIWASTNRQWYLLEY